MIADSIQSLRLQVESLNRQVISLTAALDIEKETSDSLRFRLVESADSMTYSESPNGAERISIMSDYHRRITILYPMHNCVGKCFE